MTKNTNEPYVDPLFMEYKSIVSTASEDDIKADHAAMGMTYVPPARTTSSTRTPPSPRLPSPPSSIAENAILPTGSKRKRTATKKARENAAPPTPPPTPKAKNAKVKKTPGKNSPIFQRHNKLWKESLASHGHWEKATPRQIVEAMLRACDRYERDEEQLREKKRRASRIY